MADMISLNTNSNTTLVKVKYTKPIQTALDEYNSNTTLVKVKLNALIGK